MRDIDLYKIGDTNAELQKALLDLRQDFDAHNHDGASSREFETIKAETVSARTMLIKKTSYSDSASGIWMGIVDGVMKLKLGDASNYLQWSGSALTIVGSITATTGTIGGWIIGATTLASAASGKRITLDQGNTKITLINASGSTVITLDYGTGTTNALLKINIANDARRGIEFVVGSTLGGDAKCITIDNPSTSICIDMTDAGSTGINIAGASQNGIIITHSGSAAAIDISGGPTGGGSIVISNTGDYPGIDLSYTGTATNSYGIRITSGADTLKEAILIDCNANSHLTEGMTIDRDGAADNQIVVALRIDSTNTGVGGAAVGIKFDGATLDAIMQVAADATDPTGGGGAGAGRIPIYVGSTKKYLAYY